MARLRFPGRPGHRFDRLSLKYFADDIKNAEDPALAFLPQFQRGLKLFRDIVGLSDEEEEFEGFTLKELEDGEKRFRLFQKQEKEREKQLEKARLGNTARVKISALKVQGTKVKVKTILEKSGKSLNKVKIDVDKTQSYLEKDYPLIPEKRKLKIKDSKVFGNRNKPRKFKLDYKHGFPDTDKDMAKFLLEKAKQANILQEQAKARKSAKTTTPIQKRAFVLPTQSSRSSRVIKPNKRFLEDDSVHSIVKKKSKPEEPSDSTPEKQEINESVENFPPSDSGSPSVGLLDQPLIVDGKRDRRPSLKLQLSDDELPLFSPTKSSMTSPLAAPKLGTSLFSQSQFLKVSEKQKFSMMGLGSSRLHGASIVQKAKLQLNRAALNKSKAALARSLKAEMKREAKFAVTQEGDVSPSSEPQLAVTEKRKKKKCSVCGKKNDVVLCYGEIMACLSCRRFYKECVWHIKAGIFIKPKCFQNDRCKLIPDKVKCRFCRIKKVLEVGFPPIAQLTALFKEKEKKKAKLKPKIAEAEQVNVKEKKQLETKVDVEVEPAAPSPARKRPVPVMSPEYGSSLSQQGFMTPPPTSNEDSPTKEQELSPVKAGEGSEKRRRKKKAFKEILRNKQEKADEEEKVGEKQEVIPEKPVVAEITSPVVATGSVEISPRGGPGPRIKHVCRNAAVVLGQPLATFPEKSELRLSALPTNEKVQLWKKEEEIKAATVESDDDRSMNEIIQQSGDSVVIVRKSPAKAKSVKKLTGAGGLHIYKRKMRCRKCIGCTRKDCGVCRHCLDKPKFGGPGVLKQGCVERRCSNPLIQRSATEAFIVEKKKSTVSTEPMVNVDTDDDRLEEDISEGQRTFLPHDQEPVIPGSELVPAVSGLITQTGTLLDESQESQSTASDTTVKQTENGVSTNKEKPQTLQMPTVTRGIETREKTAAKGQGSEVRKLAFDDLPHFQLERISSRNKAPGKMSSKLMKKLEMQEKYSKRGGNDGQCYPVTLQSVLPASRQWGSLLSQPRYYPIKVDFKGKQDINSAWNFGLALTMSTAMSVRTLCFLCGSSGKHEMIYCNICCEPFHEFCLEDWERPAPEHYDDWICAACQFCNVCGRQNNLLQCDKCQNTYHPGCLGPNYPTKPSKRKKIWICTKCVKCKSCGATTPGSHSQATWTYDFSLCYECGQLMDKGNFCPICHKCYSDDDWESKMIQCNKCESWVHSKCEGLTDEMYEILSYLPEDLSFYCRKCFPVGCPEWESTLKRELRYGLESILQALIMTKSSQYILKYDKRKSPPKIPNVAAEVEGRPVGSDNGVSNNFSTIRQILNTPNTEVHEESRMNNTCVKNDTLNSEASSVVSNSRTLNISTSCSEIKTCDLTSNNNRVPMETNDSLKPSLVQNDAKCEETDRADTVDSKQSGETVNVIGETEPGDSETKLGCDNIAEKSVTEENTDTSQKYDQVKSVCDNDSRSVSTEKRNSEHVCGDVCTDSVQSAGNCNKTCSNSSSDQSNKCDTENNSNRTRQCPDNVNVEQGGHTESSCAESSNVVSNSMQDTSTQDSTVCVNEDVNVQSSLEMNTKSCDSDTGGVGKAEDGKQVSCEIVPRRTQHVQFNIEGTKEIKMFEKLQPPENDYPRDLMEIAEKMKTSHYKSVAVFCEDILRVIQSYLDDDSESRVSRKKAIQSTKSIFVKQLEKIFPWFNVKTCRHWYTRSSLPDGMLPDATLPPNTDHTYAQWLERVELPRSPQPSPFKKRTATPVKKFVPVDDDDFELAQLFEGEDERKCMFCHTFGDQDSNDAGRLLYCGQDDWCHVNCALWSAEVYEDSDGELQDIVEAFSRGKMLKCDLCGKTGATVGCHTKGCKANYHFMCARQSRCRFQEDKKVFCYIHRMLIDGELMQSDKYSVLRRTYVGALNVRSVKKRWAKGLHCGDISVLIGSCCVESVGRLTDLSDRKKYLQPVDFVTTRMYWSTKDARRRCVYTCRIVEVRPEALKSPTITIRDTTIVHDPSHPDFRPFSQLDLFGINSVTEESHVSVSEKDSCIDLTVDTADLSETLSATENTMETSCEQSRTTELTISRQLDVSKGKVSSTCPRRASFSGTPSQSGKSTDKLSVSWPRSNTKSSTETNIQPGLSFLSPKTLKMLNITDPSKYMKSVETMDTEDDDSSLLRVADRLNRAAAKCSRRKCEENSSPLVARSAGNSPLPYRDQSRSPSIERGTSPMSVRPFSPGLAGKQSLHSVNWSSESPYHLSVLNPQSKFSSLLASLPEKPFSPPSRMLSRSKSLSVEKENLLSKPSIKVQGTDADKPFLPSDQPQLSPSTRRARAFSDPVDTVSLPKPLGFSSPVANKSDNSTDDAKKLVLSDISADTVNDEDLITDTEQETMETESADHSQEQDSNMTASKDSEVELTETEGIVSSTLIEGDTSNTEEIDGTSETIVVMTESGESLSEEEAIKLVKDLIEKQNSSSEITDISSVDDIAGVKDDEEAGMEYSPDLNKGEGSECSSDGNNREIEKDRSDNITKCASSDSLSQMEEDGNIPFIPKFDGEGTQSERVRRHTGDKNNVEEKSSLSANTAESLGTNVPSQENDPGSEGDTVQPNDDKTDVNQDKDSRLILINTNIDSDGENDIVDITDSVVNGASLDYTSDIKEVASTKDAEDEKVTKSIVYDLDESIDSDIEILDDLKCVKDDNEIEVDETKIDKSKWGGDRSTEPQTPHPVNCLMVDEDEIDGDELIEVGPSLSRSTKEILGGKNENFEDVKGLKNLCTIIKDPVKDAKSPNMHAGIHMVEERIHAQSGNSEVQTVEDSAIVEDIKEMSDGEHDSSKEDVLRGLGLGTCVEVERLKNSPKKPVSIPVLTPQKSPPYPVFNHTGKRKCPKLSPIKSYPLRNNTAAKHKHTGENIQAGNIENGPVDIDSESNNEMIKTDQEMTEFSKEMSPELPVLDPLAKKIKEESIAKSCAEDKGPFKCSMCRRLYRTETSYLIHVENCNFCVSSSDDDDLNEEDGTDKVKKESRKTRSRTKSLQKENETMAAEETPKSDDNAETKRASLRRSTQFQRVAFEVEKRQFAEEQTKRGRGRPSLKGKEFAEDDKDVGSKEVQEPSLCSQTQTSELSPAHSQDNTLKKGRGRPRKSEVICKNTDGEIEYMDHDEEKSSARDLRRKSRDTKLLEELPHTTDSEAEDRNETVLKRKRGRPKKSLSKDTDVVTSDGEPPVTKRKINEMSIDSVEETSFEAAENNSDFQTVKIKLKSQIENLRSSRYRPAKMVHMKKRNKTIRMYVKSKELDIEREELNLKTASVRLYKTDEKEIEKLTGKQQLKQTDVCEQLVNDEDSSEGNILDESTGLIVDKKTGEMVRSPTVKKSQADITAEDVYTAVKLSPDDIVGDEDHVDDEGDGGGEDDVDGGGVDDDDDGGGGDDDVPQEGAEMEEGMDVDCHGEETAEEKGPNEVTEQVMSEPHQDNEKTEVVNETEQKSQDSRQTIDPADLDLNKGKEQVETCDGVKATPHPELNTKDTSVNEISKEQDDTPLVNGIDAQNKEKEINPELSNVSGDLLYSEMRASSEFGAIKSITRKDSADNLPKTVLNLLKDGHKVVIRNPKLNKCFMWQKTENGYIGKPIDKDLIKSPTVDKNKNSNSDVCNNTDTSLECNHSSVKHSTASEILKERKRLESNKMQDNSELSTPTYSQFRKALTEKPEIQKKKAKFVIENIERLIENNKKAKANSMVTTHLPKGSAEYLGGILISTPRSVSMDAVKHTIQSTAPMASSMLKTTLQRRLSRESAAGLQEKQPEISSISVQKQSSIPTLSSNYSNQLQIGSEAVLQNVLHNPLQQYTAVTLQNVVQTGYNNISLTGLQSLVSMGSQFNTQIVNQSVQQVPVQQVQIPQNSSLDIGVINLPVMTSNLNGSPFVQTIATGNPPQSYINMNLQQSLINNLSPFGITASNQQSLLNAQRQSSILNTSQLLVSPQASQITYNTVQSQPSVNILSSATVPQSLTNQILYTTQTERSKQQQFHISSDNTNLTKMVTRSEPQSQSCPVYNRTTIVNTVSNKTIPKFVQDIDLRADLKNAIKQKVKENQSPKKTDDLFKVLPGLGGGSNNLLEKMKSYMASVKSSETTASAKASAKHHVVIKAPPKNLAQKKKVPKGSPKPSIPKRKYRKKNRGDKTPQNLIKIPQGKDNNKIIKRIALPHKTDKASHPMIHGQKEVTSLPVAAAEEEVHDIPLSAHDDGDGRQGADGTGHNLGHLEYEITSDDGFSCRSDSLDGAWKQVTEKVQDARTASRLKNLSYAGLSGLQMFGLSHPNVVYLIEQLYGASYCRRYTFKYHRHEMVERELELVNPTGCIRTEPYSGRNPTDMFSFLMSRYRKLPECCTHDVNEEIAMKSSRRATSMDLPMAMRFRKLKGFSKECVGVYRSPIHGRGLFCKRSIDAGEMIIEYAGEVIRNSMTDTREKYYEGKGIGCYMFRIDDTDVVDATMKGSAARFINHSCDPNCYSKVITVDNRKHIVIFAMRKILRGEELTYDYKFPIEEIKIPCTCGAKRCRRYLN